MNTNPRVRVVVLNYNGGELTWRCLERLAAIDYPRHELEVVLVDNASSDGLAERVRRARPEVRIITSPKNVGFAGGCNLGMRDLGGVEYVALLNPDTEVETGWLGPLVSALDREPGLGAACSKMVFLPRFVDVMIESPVFVPGRGDGRELGVRLSGVEVDGKDEWRGTQRLDGFWGLEHGSGDEAAFEWTRGTARLRLPVDPEATVLPSARVRLAAERDGKVVQLRSGSETVEVTVDQSPRWFELPLGGQPYDVVNNVGSVLLAGGYGADRGYLEVDAGQFDEPADVFAWCGGSVLLRRQYLDDVGLFDERFFLYYEDFDLSWRGQLRGWRYEYVPASVVRHVHSASTTEGSALFQYYVERNRLLMLVRNAPAKMAASAIWAYLLTTVSYARRDLVAPVLRGHRPHPEQVRRRLRSLAGFARLLPAMLRGRARVRPRRKLSDESLAQWIATR